MKRCARLAWRVIRNCRLCVWGIKHLLPPPGGPGPPRHVIEVMGSARDAVLNHTFLFFSLFCHLPSAFLSQALLTPTTPSPGPSGDPSAPAPSAVLPLPAAALPQRAPPLLQDHRLPYAARVRGLSAEDLRLQLIRWTSRLAASSTSSSGGRARLMRIMPGRPHSPRGGSRPPQPARGTSTTAGPPTGGFPWPRPEIPTRAYRLPILPILPILSILLVLPLPP